MSSKLSVVKFIGVPEIFITLSLSHLCEATTLTSARALTTEPSINPMKLASVFQARPRNVPKRHAGSSLDLRF